MRRAAGSAGFQPAMPTFQSAFHGAKRPNFDLLEWGFNRAAIRNIRAGRSEDRLQYHAAVRDECHQ